MPDINSEALSRTFHPDERTDEFLGSVVEKAWCTVGNMELIKLLFYSQP